MRTTLTLDDDVAALLKRLQKEGDQSFKCLVNDLLRRGLASMNEPDRVARAYRTPAVSHGRCLVGNLDDVAEVLAVAER